MAEITKERVEEEIKLFEGFCNKALEELQSLSLNTEYSEEERTKFKERAEGFEKLVEWVATKSEFFRAPASTRYHAAYSHGLLIHSNSVTKTLIKLNKALAANIPMYKCITVGLFHDLGKHNDYIENEPTPKQKAAGFKANPPYLFNELEFDPHESESIHIIEEFFHLDEDEHTAILYHNSPWDGVTKPAFKKNKLMTLIQNADYYSTVYLEDRNN